jgi:hypothetical protein
VEGTLDVRERDVDDRRVEKRHERTGAAERQRGSAPCVALPRMKR